MAKFAAKPAFVVGLRSSRFLRFACYFNLQLFSLKLRTLFVLNSFLCIKAIFKILWCCWMYDKSIVFDNADSFNAGIVGEVVSKLFLAGRLRETTDIDLSFHILLEQYIDCTDLKDWDYILIRDGRAQNICCSPKATSLKEIGNERRFWHYQHQEQTICDHQRV